MLKLDEAVTAFGEMEHGDLIEFLKGLPCLIEAYELMHADAIKKGCAPMDYYLKKASKKLATMIADHEQRLMI